MNISYTKLKKIFKKLNFKAHDLEDFERIVRRQRILTETYKMPAQVRGYYSTTLRRIYRKKAIVFNENLSETERLYVAYHELIHHFLHVSYQTKQVFYCKTGKMIASKHDAEADQLALIMIIPKWKLWEYRNAPPEEIDEFLQAMLIRREKIYADFGY